MIPELAGVLSSGLEGLLHPSRARRELAAQLRRAVLAELARSVDVEQRQRWAAVLRQDWWPVLEASREPGEDTGWPELFAAVALAQALLLGERPTWIEVLLQGRPAHALWQAEWRLNRRCILLLAERVEVCPVFVDRDVAGRSGAVEDSVVWRHDGPPLRGRSHTLMLSLLRDKVLVGLCQAVAATGEVLDDGATVGHVRGFLEKAEAWWHEEPEGLLISGPLGPMGAKDWGRLIRADWRPYDRRDEPLAWIAGGSLLEVRSKLHHVDKTIHAWDGRAIADDGLIDVRLSWRHRSQSADNDLHDPLQAATWAAARGEGHRGVLILGAPGCGKSILSRQLEQRFQGGWLGSLGYGVRRAARELGAALLKQPEASWPELLVDKEPDRSELFRELDRTRRLVPIVDGLDELDRHQLALVCARLRASQGWWIATGRPLHAVRRIVPPAWVLQVDELRPEQAKRLLEGAGRPGLASRLFPSPTGHQGRDDHVGELTKTPFHLSLLARSLDDDEALERLSDSILYSRAFKGLLDQARTDERLGDDDVRLLEGMLSPVIGELALQWLRSPTGFLSAETVDLVLEHAGVSVLDRASVIRALEFGYLLAPANEDWEFSHRTIAEWAAARALTRRVHRRLRATRTELGRELTRAERAAIEAVVFAPFITEEGLLPATGPWAQLLRFASDGVVETLPFLRQMIGPESRGLWMVLEQPRHSFGEPPPDPVRRDARDHEVLDSWNFAAELGRRTRWESAEDARTWWSMCVRRWLLLSEPARHHHHHRDGTELAFHPNVIRALPHRLSELRDLAANTPDQRSRLQEAPELLLSAIPRERAGAVRELLKLGIRAVQLRALRWFEAHAVELGWAGLNALMRGLPGELESAEAEAAAEWERVKSLPWDHPDRGIRNHHDDIRLLKELETLAWELSLRDAGDLPWAAVRERLFVGPSHLVGVSGHWMGARGHTALSERGARQRRDVLAQAAKLVAEQQELLRTGLEYYRDAPYGAKLVNSALGYFKDQEESTHRTTLRQAVAELGWELGYDRFYHHNTNDQVREVLDELKAAIRLFSSRQHRLERLVRSIQGPAVHSVAGALWAGLPLGSPVRDALGALLVGLKEVPRQVPASAVIASTSVSWYGAYGREEKTWQDHHLQELRSIATTGHGERRFRAIVLLARHAGRDERVPLLEALPTADAELVDLIRSHLGHDVPLELVTPEALPHLPLHLQAQLDAPGWRLRLLGELADSSDDYAGGALAQLAMEHHVRDALPLLVLALRAKRTRGRRFSSYGGTDDLLVAACTLMEVDDPQGSELVEYALNHGWPGKRRFSFGASDDGGPSGEENAGRFLASMLSLEHLELLGDSEVTAANRDSLRDGIRALGAEGLSLLDRVLGEVDVNRRQLREEFETLKAERRGEATERFGHGSWEQDREYESRLQHLDKVRDALVQTIIAVVDERTTPVRELVELSFRLVGGDVHHVYSTPGPLGSDFDEPGDLDWHSEQKNAGEVAGMAEKLNGALDRAPECWPELRRLFSHPSESLRKAAFQRAMVEAPPTQHVDLAIEALAGHARSNRTSWTGQTMGFTLSGSPGMGTSYVETPDTARTLVEAVRHGLTPAHRSVVEWLAQHELAPMRALACRWASELGNAEWVPVLRTLLADARAEVFASAQHALGVLSPSTWEAEILAADRSEWTEGHDQRLFRDLFRNSREDVFRIFGEEPAWTPGLTPEGLKTLVVEAVERLPAQPDERNHRADIVDGYPSYLDRALTRWGEAASDAGALDAHLLDWLDHPRSSVRCSARLALVMELDLEDLRRQLGEGEPLDRVSAALCLVQRDSCEDHSEVEAVLEAAFSFRSFEGSDLLGVSAPDPDPDGGPRWRRFEGMGDREELVRRLVDVLANAGFPWFQLFGLAMRDLRQDDEDYSWQGESERVVRLSARRAGELGEDGLIALLRLQDQVRHQQVYEHETLISEQLPRMPRLLEEVKKGLPAAESTSAYSHSAAERIWEEWSKSENHPERPDVLELLRANVYPPDW